MENDVDRKERTVYVTGMTSRLNHDGLYELFQTAGAIEKVILKENSDGSPQHALIVFRSVESVIVAIQRYNGQILDGQPIGLRPLRESSHHQILEQAIAEQYKAGVYQHRYPTRASIRYQTQQVQAALANFGSKETGNGGGRFGSMPGRGSGRERFSNHVSMKMDDGPTSPLSTTSSV